MVREVARVLVAGSLIGMAPVAVAQDETAPAPADWVNPVYTPSWSSPEFAAIAGALMGTWVSSSAVAGLEGAQAGEVVVSIAPAPIQGMSDTLLVEAARKDSLDKPFRFAVFQLLTVDGGTRIRTYELAMDGRSRAALTGLWAAPEWMPQVSADTLIATADVAVRSAQGGFAGSTVHPYPTRIGGAVEMTSEFTLAGDVWTTHDKGYGPDGSVVWGQEATTFRRSQPIAQVDKRENGLVLVTFDAGEEPVATGDRMHIHYTGYLDTLRVFDASWDRDRAFVFDYPPGNRAIAGWGMGMEGLGLGASRKLIIPGYLAYGERGNPRSGIQPNATLYFNLDCVHIDRAEPAGAEGGEATPAEE